MRQLHSHPPNVHYVTLWHAPSRRSLCSPTTTHHTTSSPLLQVDPFPAIPPLAKEAAVVESARAGVPPLEHLSRLAQRAPSMTPSLRARALRALRTSLQRQQAALYLPAKEVGGWQSRWRSG